MAIPGDRKVDGPELGLQAASLALQHLTVGGPQRVARRRLALPPSPGSPSCLRPPTLARLVLCAWTLHA